MLGFYLYARSHELRRKSLIAPSLAIVVSGIAFGCAAAVRGNGILSGIPLLLDAVGLAYGICCDLWERKVRRRPVVLLGSTVVAGLVVGVGLAFPQWLAYQEYCTIKSQRRPWCHSHLPLIYEFVQSHYW